MPEAPQDPPKGSSPEDPDRLIWPGFQGNGSPKWVEQPHGRPETGGTDPPTYRLEPVDDVRVARERRKLTVLVCICVIATLATISIVAIAVGAIPLALTSCLLVLAGCLSCIVRHYFARRDRG